jgi:hypothetical protein
MSKKTEQPEVEQNQQTEVPAAPAAEETTSKPIDVLRENGSVTLYAPTLEKLNQDALALIAAAEGNAYAGAAGYNVIKGYTIIITLKKEE